MVNKYVGAAKFGYEKVVKPAVTAIKKTFSKKSPTITSVKPGKNLTKKRKHQDDVIKTRDKIIKEYGITDPKVKTDLRTKANQPKINKKIADIQDRARVKKMGGGMMGRRFGYKGGSKKGKVPTTPKEKAFGMLSVKAKKDNNSNITLTDKIVGAKKT